MLWETSKLLVARADGKCLVGSLSHRPCSASCHSPSFFICWCECNDIKLPASIIWQLSRPSSPYLVAQPKSFPDTTAFLVFPLVFLCKWYYVIQFISKPRKAILRHHIWMCFTIITQYMCHVNNIGEIVPREPNLLNALNGCMSAILDLCLTDICNKL